LPYLDPALIATLLRRARRNATAEELAALDRAVHSEAFRASLGRIACGYDGGQIVEDDRT
jgi:hypothetical protein